MTPFEVYVTYLSLKRHFSSNYDYFKYQGKIRCSLDSYKKCSNRFFFEKLSRKKNAQEIVDFFVSNFISSDNPSTVWIGDIVKNGESIYKEYKRVKESLSYIFEEDLKTLTNQLHLYEVIKINGSKHPPLLKNLLNNTIKFETLYILVECLKLKEKYDEVLDDPIWKTVSKKISKYQGFFTIDRDKYIKIIRKHIQ